MLAALRDRPAEPLARACDRALGWLAANRAKFRFAQASEPQRRLSLLKPFAEFVLCNDLLLSYGVDDPALTTNLAWAWAELEEGEHLFRLLMARPDIVRLASVYAPLARNGFRNPRLDEALRRTAALRSNRHAETLPWMRLCFLHAMAEIERVPYDPSGAGEGWLINRPEPWCLNDDIAYAMTHEVFYAADFGRAPCALPEDVRDYLGLWVPAWAQVYAEAGNWDLTAELIIVADCLGGVDWDDDPLPGLIAAQRADGAWPGPPGAGGLFARESSADEAFYSDYHATLVATIAAALRSFRARDDKPPAHGLPARHEAWQAIAVCAAGSG